MARQLKISDDRPVVVYDADRKKIIGIFKKQVYVIKYLFSIRPGRTSIISQSLLKKHKIHNTDLKTAIALRFATPEQVKLLGNEEVVMFDESLKKYDKHILKGFDGTRGKYYAEHVIQKYDKTFR